MHIFLKILEQCMNLKIYLNQLQDMNLNYYLKMKPVFLYNLYYYYGDSSAYSVELDHTVYVCTYLCDKLGKKDTENAIYLKEILAQFEQVDFSDNVTAIVNGKKTVQQVLTEGVCDLV